MAFGESKQKNFNVKFDIPHKKERKGEAWS